MICEQDGDATQELLPLESGFWRIHSESTTARPCPLQNACVGAATFTANGNGYCNEGYEGPLCAVCSKHHYYDPDIKACMDCGRVEDSPWELWMSSPTLIILSTLFVILIGFVVNALCSKSSSELDEARKRAKLLKGRLGDTRASGQESKVALKSLLAFVQITANIGK